MTLFSVPVRLLLIAAIALWSSGCFPAGDGAADEEKDPHYLSGKGRLSGMDYDGAIAAFERALISNPKSAAAHLQLGFLYEEKKMNFGAAIYHFEKHLELRPESNMVDTVKQHIMACKLELAQTVPFALVNRHVQDDLRKLHATNALLHEVIGQLRAELVRQAEVFSNRLASATQSSAPPPVQTSSFPPPERQPIFTQKSSSPAPVYSPPRQSPVYSPPRQSPVYSPPGQSPIYSSPQLTPVSRMHVVRQGETLTMIARKYNVKLSALQAANPTVEARRLKAGQILNVPSPRN